METSALPKSSLRPVCAFLALSSLAAVRSTQAEIIIGDHAQAQFNSTIVGGRTGMPTILVAPAPSTQATYLMQRSHAWSAYQRGNASTGRSLIAAPALSGQLSATSPRQADLRTNLARAQAYRLDYFNNRREK